MLASALSNCSPRQDLWWPEMLLPDFWLPDDSASRFSVLSGRPSRLQTPELAWSKQSGLLCETQTQHRPFTPHSLIRSLDFVQDSPLALSVRHNTCWTLYTSERQLHHPPCRRQGPSERARRRRVARNQYTRRAPQSPLVFPDLSLRVYTAMRPPARSERSRAREMRYDMGRSKYQHRRSSYFI